jgi:superfamily I DNA/RNA helicase
MDVTHILDPLNDEQRQAVTAPPSHTLVLAGAGSGKTRVLVHRIAWMLATEQATPFSVLAVTFTNKAAAEMRGRIERMLGRPIGGMWVGTFHGIAHRLLRTHYKDAALPEGFQILDSEDQLRCIRRVLKDMDPNSPVNAAESSILPSFCFAPTSCYVSERTFFITTGGGSVISWWTSFRTPTLFSTPGCG